MGIILNFNNSKYSIYLYLEKLRFRYEFKKANSPGMTKNYFSLQSETAHHAKNCKDKGEIASVDSTSQ